MKSQISHVSERNKKSNLFIMCKPKQGAGGWGENPEWNRINATGAETQLPETIPPLKDSLRKKLCDSLCNLYN